MCVGCKGPVGGKHDPHVHYQQGVRSALGLLVWRLEALRRDPLLSWSNRKCLIS